MKKHLYWLGSLVILPIIAQVVLADYMSLKWTHYRWYLFISIMGSYIFSKIEFSKKTLLNFFAMYFIMGTSVAFVYKYVKNSKVNGEFLWDELTIALGITSIFYLMMFLLRRINVSVPKIFAGIQFVVLLPYLLNLGYALVEKDCVTADSLIAVYQTNINEIGEFLKSTAPLYVYFIAIFALLLIFAFLITTLKASYIKGASDGRKETISIVLAFLCIGVICNKTFHDSYFARIIRDSKGYLRSVQYYNAYRFDVNGKPKYIEATSSYPGDETFLVIIGESQNRKHMSAYGYSRDTTPWLAAQRANDNFVIMENGYACNTLTMLALSQALTEKSQYNHKALDKSYSLIDIAKAAGFKTYWISNQAQYGSYNTPITLIANCADEKIWLNSDSSASSSYDEKVLPALSSINSKGKKVIFIHLYGNHWEYNHRYPHEEYGKFDNSNYAGKVVDLQKLNAYDNSMYYNDCVTEKIFQYAKQNWNVSSIAYFSDHGEAVVSNNKHIPSKYEDDMGTVPVYFYFSDEYIKAHPAIVARTKKNKDIYFTNDMMYDALLDLWGITTPYYNAKENFLSNEYGYGAGKLLILDKIKI
ncbi:phosphoethanolamine transferase [Phascolarctobacterium succinatutens]|uniref:phosphoethanolamine transferase n=1 Tax=Phascolarctobacterium succinatutens TaxID=626940 RepID=UPI0026EA10AB|nr:phosphoethanolamine transferase [Phascolarctobacterium succinatutens]